jgi:flavin reductase (DIM6/NTAB) family NADH-FMN oxidoreductase RutF
MASSNGDTDEKSEPFDPRALRNALGTYATGVTIVTTTSADGTPIGLTCNSFSSVSLSPPLVLWSLSLRSPNLSNFLQAPHFAVNILAADQAPIAQRFARSLANKFEGVVHHMGSCGVPLIDGASAQLECRNETRYYSGDHVIFIGHVLHYTCSDAVPLVFCKGRYTEPGSGRAP